MEAVRDSHVFLYKQGMRTEYTMHKMGIFGGNDNDIVQEMNDQKAGKPRQNLEKTYMYLPEENINKWKGKIQVNPILNFNNNTTC